MRKVGFKSVQYGMFAKGKWMCEYECAHACYEAPDGCSLSLPFLSGEGREVRSGVLATADNETRRRVLVGGVRVCVTVAGLLGRDELPGRKGWGADPDSPDAASVSKNSTQSREKDCENGISSTKCFQDVEFA